MHALTKMESDMGVLGMSGPCFKEFQVLDSPKAGRRQFERTMNVVELT